MTSGRVSFKLSSGAPKLVKAAAVKTMPMGALAGVFEAIAVPNHTDSKVGVILRDLNPDRITVAHRRRSGPGETRLRRNFNMHMWRIVDALEALVRR